MKDRSGEQFGDYRLRFQLGAGTFGEVYEAEHLYLNTRVAIKVLTHLDQADFQLFVEEARKVAALEHPHIVRVLGFSIQDQSPYLVMQLAPRGSLKNLLTGNAPRPATELLPYLQQAADGLHYAHEQRLIHLDIKPANLLLDAQGQVLLADFGLALILQPQRTHQTVRDFSGTPAYAAPEQFQHKPGLASDQYSLAVIAYHWITGSLPFQGDWFAIGHKKLSEEPPLLRATVPDLSPGVEQVVRQALARNPGDRFPSVRDFALAFEQACQEGSRFTRSQAHPSNPGLSSLPLRSTSLTEGLSSSARQQTPALSEPPGSSLSGLGAAPNPSGWRSAPEPEQPWSEQRSWSELPPARSVPPQPAPSVPTAPQGHISRRAVLVAGGLAGVAIVGGVLSVLALEGQPRAGQPGSVPSATARSGTSRTVTSTPTLTPTPAPPGTTLLTYRGHASEDMIAAAWSPDGARIASAGSSGTVQVWNALTGVRTYVYTGHSGAVLDVAWSPDGIRIASGGVDNSVLVWNAADGSHVLPYFGHASWVRVLAWSPDGKRIASGSADKTVQVWDTTHASQLFAFRDHTQAIYATSWSPDGKGIASGGDDQTLRVWDATNGSSYFPYRANIGGVYQTAWSPDGKRLATASGNHLVQVWDAHSGDLLFVYRGHSKEVWTVAWSPDGKRIASGSGDHTVQIWDAADGGHAFLYRGHTDLVHTVAWSPDGTRIASASRDGTVQIWQVG